MHESSDPTTQRHATRRHETGSGQIRLELRRPWAGRGLEAPTVLVNGFPLDVPYGESVVRVPAGPMRVEVRRPGARGRCGVEVDFVLGEGDAVDLRFSPSKLRSGRGRLVVAAVRTPTTR